MSAFRSIIFSLALATAACGVEPRDRGQATTLGNDRSGAALTFGAINQVEGTPFFTIPIVRSDRSRKGSFSSYDGGSDERNRLIVDSLTGASRKVLPDADFSIARWIEPTTELRTRFDRSSRTTESDSNFRGSGLYAAVVRRPGKTEKEPATYDLLLGRFADGKQEWIARGLASVETAWITGDNKLAVVGAAKTPFYRLYDPNTFEQLLEAPLSL